MTEEQADHVASALSLATGDTFDTFAENVKGKGKPVRVLRPDDSVIYGMRLPYFSLRWLFRSSVLPCGKTVMLGGQPGSGKTSLALWFSGLFLRNGGGALGIHTEDKWPDTLPASIMGDELAHRLRIWEFDDMEAWTLGLEQVVRDKLLKDERLRRVPFISFVDSVMGADSDADIKKVRWKGVTRGFSSIARNLSKWCPIFGKTLTKSSMTTFFLYHLKFKDGQWYTPGGSAPDFYASYTFYLYHDRNKDHIVQADGSGYNDVTIVSQKDSYGAGGTSLPLRMSWSMDENGKQVTEFSWAEATCQLLQRWTNKSKDDGGLNATHPLRQVLKVNDHAAGSLGKKYSCSELGIEKCVAEEFCAAMEENREASDEIDRIMGVANRPTLDEYWAEIDAVRAAEEEAKKAGKKAKKTRKRRKKKATTSDADSDDAQPAIPAENENAGSEADDESSEGDGD